MADSQGEEKTADVKAPNITAVAASKDSVKVQLTLDLMLDPDKLRCLTSKEGLSTTITVIT